MEGKKYGLLDTVNIYLQTFIDLKLMDLIVNR